MIQWRWAALAVAAFVGGRLSAKTDPARHWSERTGEDWRALGPQEQQAYTDGFLAGAAFGQAVQERCHGRSDAECLGRAEGADSAGLDTTMARFRRTGGFRLPFGANVYVSRMNDFYWWENHRPLPTWYAFWEVNTTLIGPTNDPAR